MGSELLIRRADPVRDLELVRELFREYGESLGIHLQSDRRHVLPGARAGTLGVRTVRPELFERSWE